MSSTEDERRARAFFREKLLPAAAALRERGVAFFPLGPDDADSWFEAPPAGDPFLTLGDLETALREHWEAEGLPELAALARSLADLADALEIREQDSADVSPFVYVMY
jgi:hypothetical protein